MQYNSFSATPFEPSTLVELLRFRADYQPDQTAYTFLLDGETEEISITYKELDRCARAIGAKLQSLGISENLAILLYPTGLEYICAFFGCLYGGAIAIPSYPPRLNSSTPRLRAIATDAQPSVLLCNSEIQMAKERLSIFNPELKTLHWIVTDNLSDELENMWQKPEISGDTIAFLQYTSGSTGSPKGVMLSHDNLLQNQQMIKMAFQHTEKEIVLGWLPLFHDMGLIGNVFQPLYLGARCILMSPIHFLQRPLRWLQAITRYKATTSGGPNFSYDLCVRKITPEQRADLDLSSWQIAFNGAEHIHAGTLDRFAESFEAHGFSRKAFFPCYGLAEATLIVSGGDKGAWPVPRSFNREALEQNRVEELSTIKGNGQRLLGCGQILPGQKILIVDPETLKECPTDQVGEIWISGSNIAKGYWKRTDETESIFGVFLSGTSEGPFLRTGDLGFIKDGELFITGRLKELIIIRGRNYYPQDIEITVEQSHPALRKGCGAAFSIDINDEEQLVIVHEIERHYRNMELDEVIRIIRQAVSAEHEVQVYAVVLIKTGSLPKTSSGKIQRRACRSKFLSGSLKTIVEWKMSADRERRISDSLNLTRESIFAIDTEQRQQVLESDIKNWIAQMLEFDNPSYLNPNKPLYSLGVDSVMAVQLQNIIENRMGVILPLMNLLGETNIKEITMQVQNQLHNLPSPQSSKSLSYITPDPGKRYLPFPLNDIQQAYWVGRTGSFELGNVSAHFYAEFESDKMDQERLNLAWQKLIERHDMLRAIIRADGQQQIIEHVSPYRIKTIDLQGQPTNVIEHQLDMIRQRMSHQKFKLDQWPLFEIRAAILNNHRIRLYFSIDLLIADARSLIILFKEWSQFYENPECLFPPLELSFRDYIVSDSGKQNLEAYERSQVYWRSRLSTLPPAPELPLAKNPGSLTQHRFVRYTKQLDSKTWLRLKTRASKVGLTPSGVLCASFSEILRTWSKRSHFTINLTLFNRLPVHRQVNDIVGDFTSLVMLEVDHSQNTFEDRAKQLQKQLFDDLDHRHISGVQILRELSCAQALNERSIMPVVFTSVLEDISVMDGLGEIIYSISQTPQVWLDHQVFERNGALILNWDAVEELFPEGLLSDMFSAYFDFLRSLADDEKMWKNPALQLVPQKQLEQRKAINKTDSEISNELLHTLFISQMFEHPDREAVTSSVRTLTYEELYKRSSKIGHQLRQLGALPNTLIAVVMEKGWEQVVAVLGILQSGAAYLPIDPKLPKDRLWYLLENGEVRIVLTQSRLDIKLEWPQDIKRLCLDEDNDKDLLEVNDQSLEPVQKPEDLAYVIYTSGSTGLPKGVMIDHRGAVNTILDINHRFGVGTGDRLLALSSLSFDLSVYDIFGTLASGGTIVIPDKSAERDPAHWAKLIHSENVAIWNSVPALMQMLVEYSSRHARELLCSLRLVLLSGDWIPINLPDQIKALINDVQVISLGGATEASVWSIFYPIETLDPAWKSIPYGRPLINQRFHVLNDAMEPCPEWVPGQLYIGGIGLAKGYFRDEEKTRSSFIKHPLTGEQLYRTGDLGRYLPDGNIEFLGREDSQIKIHGYRIELGEIEAALVQHPAVDATVVNIISDSFDNKHLVGYVVPASENTPVTAELKDYLKRKLPEYMIPSIFMPLDSLPLTPNGKVNRAALPIPKQISPEPPQELEDYKTDLTSQLTRLVAGVLKIESINPATSFMDLGANSVDMIRIANLLESEFGFRPEMEDLFRCRNLADLSRYYEQAFLKRESLRGHEEWSLGGRGERSVLASCKILLDPKQREKFRKKQPGLRKIEKDRLYRPLQAFELNESLKRKFTDRRSHREFLHKLIPFDQFGKFLGCLRQITIDGKPKYIYGSAGGVYPVQTYLYIKQNCVEKISGGTYYYDPLNHSLILLSADAILDRGIHWPENANVFDQSAFSIFLIAQLNAISPLYGEKSLDFATIEAGLISQLLEGWAPECHIGLCQIGMLEFERIRNLFMLEETHVIIHSLLGGLVDINPFEYKTNKDHSVTGLGQERDIAHMEAQFLKPDDQLQKGSTDFSKDFSIVSNVTDLKAEAILDPDILIEGVPFEPLVEPKHIFLTGATGFLGAFLLHELLQQTQSDIYCLVRSPNALEGKQKIQINLEVFSLWDKDLSHRIIVVPGDLSKPYLDLSSDQFYTIADKIDVIYHNAAWVNWIYPYSTLKAANVCGTYEVLRLACQTRLKPVHLTSSTAVFPFNGRAFREDDSLDYDDFLYGGYAQTKWVAEKLVTIARSRGLPVCIYRPTIVSAHSQTGVFNSKNYLENMIKGCIQLGGIPDLNTMIDISPVDYVSKSIVYLSKQPESLSKVFHLTNPRPIHMKTFFNYLRSLGYRLCLIPFNTWKRELFNSQDFQENALFPFWKFLANLEEHQTIMPVHDCQNTLSSLAGASITCPPADTRLLDTYFKQYIKSGFLNNP